MAPAKSSDVDHHHDNVSDEEEGDRIALEMHVIRLARAHTNSDSA